MVTLLVAKAFGAQNIVITDMSEERLKIAKQLGATATVNVTGLDTAASDAAIRKAFAESVNADELRSYESRVDFCRVRCGVKFSII